MDFQKVAEAIEKSSPEIKNIMFSSELGEKTQIIAIDHDLDEETFLKFSDEIGYVILGLKSRTSFYDALLQIGIDKNTASHIAKEVETKIFNELDKIKNKEGEMSKSAEESKPQSKVGESFEQIILNQARAMQPARPTGESTVGGPAREPGEIPQNLPTEKDAGIKNEKGKIHNYLPGQDPYREPTE